jgi:hypothetical protein
VLFSKAGFTDRVVESRDERWSLFDLDSLESLL